MLLPCCTQHVLTKKSFTVTTWLVSLGVTTLNKSDIKEATSKWCRRLNWM